MYGNGNAVNPKTLVRPGLWTGRPVGSNGVGHRVKYLHKDTKIGKWCGSLGRRNLDWKPLFSIYCAGEDIGKVFYTEEILPTQIPDPTIKWTQIREFLDTKDFAVKIGNPTVEVRLLGLMGETAILQIPEYDRELIDLPYGYLLHVVRMISNNELAICHEHRAIFRSYFQVRNF